MWSVWHKSMTLGPFSAEMKFPHLPCNLPKLKLDTPKKLLKIYINYWVLPDSAVVFRCEERWVTNSKVKSIIFKYNTFKDLIWILLQSDETSFIYKSIFDVFVSPNDIILSPLYRLLVYITCRKIPLIFADS